MPVTSTAALGVGLRPRVPVQKVLQHRARTLSTHSTSLLTRKPRPHHPPARRIAGIRRTGSSRARGLATAASGTPTPPRKQHCAETAAKLAGTADTHGPIAEYDRRVDAGRLRNDEHQRTLIQSLQDLHEMLVDYNPPEVTKPDPAALQQPKKTFLSSIFGSKPAGAGTVTMVPASLPMGLYMYGDVGSGKTMLMDLFFDTLPPNIQHKTRIHFHNFMQETHKALHKVRVQYGHSVDGVPLVAADIASRASVLCFDEFQVTDIADAMILRRLVEALMTHGTVIVTTSNRHPTELYKNGIQRESFIPCINLLQTQLKVLNLDSTTDYRKIARPPSGVYHHPLDKAAQTHADKWFSFLGDPENDPPHPASHTVWGRQIEVPEASGRCARFPFKSLIMRATGAADYLELMRSYDAFIVTDVPTMTLRERDWARRFITFIDAVYESRAKLVLTTAAPLQQLFLSKEDLRALSGQDDAESAEEGDAPKHMLMDDVSLGADKLKKSNMFAGDEEAFAFARALSRLTEMASVEWVERGMGLERKGGQLEKESWQRVRSRWREDAL